MPEQHDHEIEVFNVALELPAARRAAYLEVACAGNPALRQRLEAMLAADEQTKPVLPKGNAIAKATIKLDLPAAPDDNAVGQLIGRYKLLEKVGEGGCGVVYVAQQHEPVHRRVALKVIKPGMDSKEVIARFEAERQALAMMDHPNIAKVLDAGTTETGRPYFVMELVRGIKITEYCDQNQLSTKERLDLFIKICQAIQHAHQKGIIHRDIKPSNILVTLHDGVPVPKVIDFGIAKATEGRLTDATVYTQLHQFIGTPAYMSPEQAEMSGLDIDTRSDIYSLGVLLYELLAGSTPFDAKELMSQGIDAMRKIIREQEPVRPSTRFATLPGADLTTTAKRRSTDTSKLLHQLRGDLDWIVMKCLEKDRTRRYETANGLSADLLRHINNEPVVARPPSNAYRLQKMVRRNKLACAAAAAVALALLLGVVATIRAEREQAQLRQEAVSEAQKARSEAKRAKTAESVAQQRLAESEAISKFLKEVFQSPDPARDGRTITVVETLGAAAKRLDTQLANQPALRAKLQSTLGLTYRSLGLYREAIPLQEKVRDYYRASYGPEHPETLMAMTELGNSYFADGRRDEALNLREQVLALFRNLNGSENVDTLVAMNNLGNSYFEAGRLDEALKLREQVLVLRRKISGPENFQTLRAMNNLAASFFESGRPDEALRLEEQVVALRRKVIGPEHPETISAMQNLAGDYDAVGRRAEALNFREQALAISRRVNGPEHPRTLIGMNELAISYDEAGRRDEALKLREQVLAVRRKVLGAVHPDTLAAMNDVARTLAASQSAEIRNGTNAMRLAEEAVAAAHHTNPDFLDTLAAACAETGQFERAVAVEREAVGLTKSEENKKDYATRLKLYQASTPYRDSGNP